MPAPVTPDLEAIMRQARLFAGTTTALFELIKLLVVKGILDPQEILDAYEEASNDILKRENGAEGVAAMEAIRAQIVRVPAAGIKPTRRAQ